MLTSVTYLGAHSLFTFLAKPGEGEYPTYVMRNPYVDGAENATDEELIARYLGKNVFGDFLAHGYAVVYQHCRGRGRSGGDCIPYIYEREDGLQLLDWIREQPHYNGKIYLGGGSYLTSVHYAVAPFAPDICGGVLMIQDSERYNEAYRNGVFKKGLYGDWYVGMYKHKSMPEKPNGANGFSLLPLTAFSRAVFGEDVDSFDRLLRAPRPDDPFWQTLAGGTDSRDVLTHADMPVLLCTAWYDIYTGGIFDMWNALPQKQKAQSALFISANDHCDDHVREYPDFPVSRREEYRPEYPLGWIDFCDRNCPPPVEVGKVTYYRLFENRWHTDDFPLGTPTRVSLGEGIREYVYDPAHPTSFRGGLSCNFDGAQYQAPPGIPGIVTEYSAPFAADTVVQGKMAARLVVRSDCEDSCFLLRVSVETPEGDFPLRDDIVTLCRDIRGIPGDCFVTDGRYTPGAWKALSLSFDEHSFKIFAGQRLRFDFASADAAHYVCHTNQKGPYYEQETAKIAHNAIDLSRSVLYLPVLENC